MNHSFYQKAARDYAEAVKAAAPELSVYIAERGTYWQTIMKPEFTREYPTK